jgi:hypothetical protein
MVFGALTLFTDAAYAVGFVDKNLFIWAMV